jgi:hypothetical protein
MTKSKNFLMDDFGRVLEENYSNIPENYLWWLHSAIENNNEQDAIKLIKRLFLAKTCKEQGYVLHPTKPQVRKDGNIIPFFEEVA